MQNILYMFLGISGGVSSKIFKGFPVDTCKEIPEENPEDFFF